MARLVQGRRSLRPKAIVRCAYPVLPQGPNQEVLRKVRFTRILMRQQWLLLTLTVFACLCLPAQAQTDVNDVHIQPREVEKHLQGTLHA